MIEDVNSLPDDPALLKKLLVKQAARLMFLEEQFRLAQQQRFGASSESHPAQGDLFNEAETELDVADDAIEPTTTVKKKPVRKKLPADLPRETIIVDIVITQRSFPNPPNPNPPRRCPSSPTLYVHPQRSGIPG